MLSNTVNHLVPSNVSNEGENWKRVSRPEYSHKYLVSDQGRVFNLDRGVLVSQICNGPEWGKYLKVNLHVAGIKRKLVTVHKLVGETWLPDYRVGCVLDHKDRDKLNNLLCNLRVVDYRLNNNNHPNTTFVYYKGFTIPISYAMELEFEGHNTSSPQYQYVRNLLTGLRVTFEEALACYYNVPTYGKVYSVRFTLEDGRDVNLFQWCQYHKIPYLATRRKISTGWTSNEILSNTKKRKPPKRTAHTHKDSIETETMWFPNKLSFARSCSISNSKVYDAILSGVPYDVIYTMKQPQPHSEVITLTNGESVTLNLKELSVLVNLGSHYVKHLLMNSNNTSFQDIYNRSHKVVRSHSINKVVKGNNVWAAYFGISKDALKSYLRYELPDGSKRSMKEALTFYGVDTTGMDIQPY